MENYRIRGALGGGFGGCDNVDWVYDTFKNENDAMSSAYELACEEYEMYDGMHGLRSVEDIMEEEDIDYEEAEEVWYEERETWLDYEAELVKG